jgi:hypothetical protein
MTIVNSNWIMSRRCVTNVSRLRDAISLSLATADSNSLTSSARTRILSLPQTWIFR